MNLRCFFSGHKPIWVEGENKYITKSFRKCSICDVRLSLPEFRNAPPPPTRQKKDVLPPSATKPKYRYATPPIAPAINGHEKPKNQKSK